MPAENPTADLHVRFERVRMAFGGRTVFESLSCGFPRGAVSAILGGSGSGKSTMLRLVGGLIRPQSGAVFVDGEDVTRLSERKLYGVRRKIGMMFQGGALLDSTTVFDNIAFPLREHTRMTEDEIAAAVNRRLEAVALSPDVGALLPSQLSGGMVRRVALARAIIREPSLLLCDEPFSGLDPASTKRIEALLKHVNRELGITVIVVSHHIPSTMRMADRALLLLPWGAVAGTPDELARSTDRRVVDFLDEDTPPDEDDFAEPEERLSSRA